MDLRKHSNQSNLVRFKLTKASDGKAFTGLTSSSSGLLISTIADVEASATDYTQASSNIETITTLGTFAAPTSGKCRFKEVDATKHPGLYEFQFADARFAVSSARRLVISVSGVTDLFSCDYEIRLVQFDPDDAAKLGLSELNAAYSILNNGTHGNAALKTLIDDLPTNSEFNARTLAAGDYFDPAADAVANVTAVGTTNNLTNLPTMPADWITAAGLSAAAVAKIEAALLNEGDGNALIDAIVQAIDAADIDTDILPALIRDAILNRVLAGNHDMAGTLGKLVQNLDAAVSSRGTADPGDQMDLVNAPNATALTAIENEVWEALYSAHQSTDTMGQVLATGASVALTAANNTATILARLGAWTGSGVNTILGAFRATLNKAASLPSDIGGTHNPATDTLEPIADAIAGIGGGGGGGGDATAANQGTIIGHLTDIKGTGWSSVTDTLKKIRDAITAIGSGGGGGGGGISIIPVTQKHRVGEPSPITVAAFVDADFTHAFRFSGDLTAETFTFAVEISPGNEDVAADYAPALSYDAGSNQTTITPTIDRSVHTVEAIYRYALRHVSGTNAPIAWGDYIVSYAPDSIAP